MPATELTLWRAADALCLFGERRADKRIAKLTAHLIAAIPLGEKKGITVEEFMLDAEPVAPEQTEEEMFDTFDAAAQRQQKGS